jgi:hypothetical protein
VESWRRRRYIGTLHLFVIRIRNSQRTEPTIFKIYTMNSWSETTSQVLTVALYLRSVTGPTGLRRILRNFFYKAFSEGISYHAANSLPATFPSCLHKKGIEIIARAAVASAALERVCASLRVEREGRLGISGDDSRKGEERRRNGAGTHYACTPLQRTLTD